MLQGYEIRRMCKQTFEAGPSREEASLGSRPKSRRPLHFERFAGPEPGGARHDCDELLEDVLFSRAQSLDQIGLCRWASAPQPASAVLELKPEPVVGNVEVEAL